MFGEQGHSRFVPQTWDGCKLLIMKHRNLFTLHEVIHLAGAAGASNRSNGKVDLLNFQIVEFGERFKINKNKKQIHQANTTELQIKSCFANIVKIKNEEIILEENFQNSSYKISTAKQLAQVYEEERKFYKILRQ